MFIGRLLFKLLIRITPAAAVIWIVGLPATAPIVTSLAELGTTPVLQLFPSFHETPSPPPVQATCVVRPVPVSATLKGFCEGSLLAMCNAPVRLDAPPGVKVTVKVVLDPAATVPAGGVVRVKSLPLVPSNDTPETVKGFWPVFLSV